MLFPVVKNGDTATGTYDDLYIEAAAYSDGFAKIVHANQPVSGNLLAEEQDGFHPQKEMGIRLGWDDEQILIWYLRQLAKDNSVNSGADRLDAPLGVMGYHIDVKYDAATEEGAPAAGPPAGTAPPENNWESVTAVKSNGNMLLENIDIGQYEGELPFQVYPVKLYGATAANYWLPMYFANWNDHSLVLPDKTAAEIYQNQNALKWTNGINNPAIGTEKPEDRSVKISDTYKAKDISTKLKYGHSYNFRIRLTDISGGGPGEKQSPSAQTLSNQATTPFKRYVAPYALRIKDEVPGAAGAGVKVIEHSTDDLNFKGDMLIVQRPLIGYPAVAYTDKYTDPVTLLKASVASQLAAYVPGGPKVNVQIGLADPDVVSVAIKVEVETLQMDNLASDDGKENYITLYNTTRKFDSEYESELALTFTYKDYASLNLAGADHNPFNNADDNATIGADSGNLILPTNRNIRISLRAVCEGNESYWGYISDKPDLDSRYGKVTVIKTRKDSLAEPELFETANAAKQLQAIYLQPDPQPVYTGKVGVKQVLPVAEGMPSIVQRLAKQLDVNSNNMTLTANKGERLQFWCSNLIRHTLSPDNSSITFAGKNELIHHWIVVTSLTVKRDWAWDGLNTLAFDIARKKSLENNPVDFQDRIDKLQGIKDYTSIGSLELKRIAPFQAIQEGDDGLIHREYTKIIFIDVLDPLPEAGKLPNTILAQYQITPKFKLEGVQNAESFETRNILLPATINPHQIPKVIGAGIALSPYVRNDKYSYTEARKRFLWLEFENAPDDSRDQIFARQLAYAPDQLLSNNQPSLFEIKEEPPLPVDPEYIRVITPDSAHDHAGLKAMQKMEKSTDDGRHFYLLPLPEGMHPESAELFGFHTYEFRYGHTDALWSTAQGRFGRPFRLTGLQHPAPTLLCTVTRDDKQLGVSAPFAMAVSNGRNVTSNPPRTSIWALLYAQVRQADGKGYRNILLDEQKLTVQPIGNSHHGLTTGPLDFDPGSLGFSPSKIILSGLQKNQQQAQSLEAVKYAEGSWDNVAVEDMLYRYGLPEDAAMSVVCVEVFGYIRNVAEHINNVNNIKNEMADSISLNLDKDTGAAIKTALVKPVTVNEDKSLPLSDHLGLYRILRTSPLTEVPFVCCT
ncbi:MAG: hypothetical protein JKY70_21705 [Mucilaginibacter sp.]|nr:hypothetical protein [Mucilaginibacter sp.]